VKQVIGETAVSGKNLIKNAPSKLEAFSKLKQIIFAQPN